MIGRDQPMALVVTKDKHVKVIVHLGYCTLDGNEMHRISTLAEKQGCYAYTTTVEEDFESFEQLYREVEKAIT